MASDGPGSTPLLSSFPEPACYMARPGDFCQKTWIGTKARNGTESYHAHRSAAARGATGLAANVVSALCAKTDSPLPCTPALCTLVTSGPKTEIAETNP